MHWPPASRRHRACDNKPNSTIRRSLVVTALAAVGIVAVDDTQAVRISADNRGQALIYPYYTARSTAGGNAYVTALSITNSTASAKAVKVRFIEGKAGAEVFDLNLFLDAYDIWTAGVVGAGAGAGVFTQDRSCTTPGDQRESRIVHRVSQRCICRRPARRYARSNL